MLPSGRGGPVAYGGYSGGRSSRSNAPGADRREVPSLRSAGPLSSRDLLRDPSPVSSGWGDRATLTRLVHDLGVSVLLAEHRLERVIPFADRMCLLAGEGRMLVGAPAIITGLQPSRFSGVPSTVA